MQNILEWIVGTFYDCDQLDKIDDTFDGVTGGIDNDNEDEDTGDKDVSSFSCGRFWQEESFLLDCLVE